MPSDLPSEATAGKAESGVAVVVPGAASPERSASAADSRRIEFLDSIRGLAALAVLLSHSIGVVTPPAAIGRILMSSLTGPLIDGKAAVAMFFVLSGFVLSRPYLRLYPEGAPVVPPVLPFYMKRVMRIYVPFVCVLSLSAVARNLLFHHYQTVPPATEGFQRLWSRPWSVPDFLKQCLFIFHNAEVQLMNQDWSLGVELKASALLPFFLFAFQKSPWALLGLGGAIAWLTGMGPCYFSFVLGIFFAAYVRVIAPRVTRQGTVVKVMLLIAGLALYQARRLVAELLPGNSVLAREGWIWTATSLGCILILLAAFGSARVRKVLTHSALVFLGRISYGVYLLQFVLLLVFTPWVVYHFNELGLRSGFLVWPLAVAVTVASVIGVSAVFYRLVEAPSMKLGRNWAAALASKPELSKAPERAS